MIDQKQLLITTHSEHILLGFLENIMKGNIKPEDIRIYFSEKAQGIAKFSNLPVNKNGEIEGGLRGFIDADMEHMRKFLQVMESKNN